MTMPTLHNCPHQGDGWCLSCLQTELKANVRGDGLVVRWNDTHYETELFWNGRGIRNVVAVSLSASLTPDSNVFQQCAVFVLAQVERNSGMVNEVRFVDSPEPVNEVDPVLRPEILPRPSHFFCSLEGLKTLCEAEERRIQESQSGIRDSETTCGSDGGDGG